MYILNKSLFVLNRLKKVPREKFEGNKLKIKSYKNASDLVGLIMPKINHMLIFQLVSTMRLVIRNSMKRKIVERENHMKIFHKFWRKSVIPCSNHELLILVKKNSSLNKNCLMKMKQKKVKFSHWNSGIKAEA